MTKLQVVVLGPPAAGKTTHARRIADEYDLEYVHTGEVLRANEAMETDYGTPAEFIERGELVPDPVTNEIVGEVLTNADGFVLDGYPRTLGQAEFLDGIADLDLVLFLDVSEDTVTTRLIGRRACEECDDEFYLGLDVPADAEECPTCDGELVRPDDATPEVAARRLDEYNDETVAVVEFYQQRGMVTAVDAERPLDEVWQDVRVAVERAR